MDATTSPSAVPTAGRHAELSSITIGARITYGAFKSYHRDSDRDSRAWM
jgi:hypothetical protein